MGRGGGAHLRERTGSGAATGLHRTPAPSFFSNWLSTFFTREKERLEGPGWSEGPLPQGKPSAGQQGVPASASTWSRRRVTALGCPTVVQCVPAKALLSHQARPAGVKPCRPQLTDLGPGRPAAQMVHRRPPWDLRVHARPLTLHTGC